MSAPEAATARGEGEELPGAKARTTGALADGVEDVGDAIGPDSDIPLASAERDRGIARRCTVPRVRREATVDLIEHDHGAVRRNVERGRADRRLVPCAQQPERIRCRSPRRLNSRGVGDAGLPKPMLTEIDRPHVVEKPSALRSGRSAPRQGERLTLAVTDHGVVGERARRRDRRRQGRLERGVRLCDERDPRERRLAGGANVQVAGERARCAERIRLRKRLRSGGSRACPAPTAEAASASTSRNRTSTDAPAGVARADASTCVASNAVQMVAPSTAPTTPANDRLPPHLRALVITPPCLLA